ncbi:hypothetical protein [Exiguobacterium sp. s193]|uniref:hypothetical protein n=1 Tax=Exiguobacterium sp. s193 TaxID=2751207 RepID=UPI001BEA674C|nr:hypothetical protein [Exiguobacterium sp. s193]
MNLSELFKTWINHPKETHGRNNLERTDECWKKVLRDIRKWEISEDKELNEYAERLLYIGEVKRVHLNLDEVNYNNHYVSWTSSENLNDLYWFDSSYNNYTIITAKATRDNPGISVIGYIELMKKFEDENFELNSPAIRKEQEVIFPLNKQSKLSIERVNIQLLL